MTKEQWKEWWGEDYQRQIDEIDKNAIFLALSTHKKWVMYKGEIVETNSTAELTWDNPFYIEFTLPSIQCECCGQKVVRKIKCKANEYKKYWWLEKPEVEDE